MKHLRVLLPILFLAGVASAQVALNQTTLSGAVTTTNQQMFRVASTTNIAGPTITQNGAGNSFQLYIDDEMVDVESVPASGLVQVRRGANGTRARTHATGTNVYIVPVNSGAAIAFSLGGSCGVSISGSNDLASPMIDYTDGYIFQCVNGLWALQSITGQQHFPNDLFVAASYTNATTTFSNVSGLSFPVAGNHTYALSCNVSFQGSATTAGPKFQFTGPGSPTSVNIMYDGGTGAAAYADAVSTAFSSSQTAFGTIGAGATNYVVHINVGLINGANSGTVQLQAAANGAGTLTINPGSYCIQQ